MYANLKADDIPGSKSHFEREVDFTAQTLATKERTFVFVDELFHTTNPPDALQACRLYCNELWSRKNIVSIISTHIFELVEQSPELTVQRICCPAKQNDNGTVDYYYGLESGICKISSVFEILEKYGYKLIKSAVDMNLKKSEDGQK